MVQNMVKVRVLNEKDKKTRAYFLVDGYEPVDVIAMDIRVQVTVKKGQRRDIKILARLIGLQKIMDGIQIKSCVNLGIRETNAKKGLV